MTINLPWYKQGWPWVIISIPLSAVLFGVVMITVASQNPDDLVADDYYKEGMAINERLARDHKATELGIEGELVHREDDRVQFHFSGANDSAVVFNMYHVIDQDEDLQVVLYPDDEPGTYSTTDLAVTRSFGTEGTWYLEFEGVDDNWRLRSRVRLPVDNLEIRNR